MEDIRFNKKDEPVIYKNVVSSPFSNLNGEELLQRYNDVSKMKINIDWELYCLCLEINNRLNYLQANGINSLPEQMIPIMKTNSVAGQSTNEKIIIKEDEIEEFPIGLNSKRMSQNKIDEIVQKELQKQKKL